MFSSANNWFVPVSITQQYARQKLLDGACRAPEDYIEHNSQTNSEQLFSSVNSQSVTQHCLMSIMLSWMERAMLQKISRSTNPEICMKKSFSSNYSHVLLTIDDISIADFILLLWLWKFPWSTKLGNFLTNLFSESQQ